MCSFPLQFFQNTLIWFSKTEINLMSCHVFADPYNYLYIFPSQIPVILGVNRAYRVKREWSESRLVMSDSFQLRGLYSPWNSLGQNTAVDSLSLLWGIFPTQGLNPGLLHCRRVLYQLSHKGSPRILEWVAYLFSRRSSQPRNWTRVSCISGGFFAHWAIREAHVESTEGLIKYKAYIFRTDHLPVLQN